jgi:tetratricopeptide (TPR) repeat protein
MKIKSRKAPPGKVKSSPALVVPRWCIALGVTGLILFGMGCWFFSRRAFTPFQPGASPQSLASQTCRECHPAEYESWRSSHHALAERAMDVKIDRTAFDPAHVFKAGSKTNEARFHNDRFEIITMGLNTNIEAYPVERVIGVEPLRQFLTATGNGRWQAQEDAYDPKTDQWFDVFGGDDRQPGEWGHWTGRGMNWNSTCAECHNTRLQKNYDDATDSYHTTMDEMAVGCGACHASLNEHAAWQREHPGGKEKDPTLARPSPAQILGTCGSCHSRREDMTGNIAPGHSFFDQYQMQILDETDTWFADGQVHGEDYEFASFLGSKMSQRGVICLDCHDPHSGRTILPGNNLCLRCHNGSFTNAPIIQPAEHSHHDIAGAGNQCMACHMPVTVYMQRHARHDHGFTIPDPLLTRELGIPNACNRCHTNKSADWAVAAAEKWYGQKMERHTRARARWLAAAQKGEDSAKSRLIEMLAPARESFYWRAAAAGLLWRWPDDAGAKAALLASLKDNHPLVREKAINSLEPAAEVGDDEVVAALRPMLNDAFRNVRVAAAWVLRASLDTNSSAGQELQTMLDFNADQPIGQYREAKFALSRHDPTGALACLRKATAWDPYSPPFRLEIADVLTQLGRTNEAVRELQELCRLQPQSVEGQFKLGLALADAQQIEPAVAAFKQAVKLDPENALAWYNLGLAASAIGQVEESLAALDRAAALAPKDPQIPYERARTLARAGRYQEARTAAQKAVQLQPDFKPALDLLDALPP